jgi:DNA-binding MarR family transcriptional regulator
VLNTVTQTRRDGLRQPAVLAWLRLIRVYQQVERAASAPLRQHDLSPAQFDVIAHVGAAEGLTQQELAASLLVTKGNVTQLLDRLEGCGLIERRQLGRAKRIFLTERGRTVFCQVVPAHEARISAQFAALSLEEQRELHRLLRKLDRALRTDERPKACPERSEGTKDQ